MIKMSFSAESTTLNDAIIAIMVDSLIDWLFWVLRRISNIPAMQRRSTVWTVNDKTPYDDIKLSLTTLVAELSERLILTASIVNDTNLYY